MHIAGTFFAVNELRLWDDWKIAALNFKGSPALYIHADQINRTLHAHLDPENQESLNLFVGNVLDLSNRKQL